MRNHTDILPKYWFYIQNGPHLTNCPKFTHVEVSQISQFEGELKSLIRIDVVMSRIRVRGVTSRSLDKSWTKR